MSEGKKKVGKRSLSKKKRKSNKRALGDELSELNIWNRKEHDGFTTIPRTLNYINRIIDYLAGAGSPVSQTYLSLWCRGFDEGFVEIRDKDALAFESGFSGQRAVTTWLGRMKKLRELGLISTSTVLLASFIM
ncbi:hypothetical protein AB2E66_26590 (plasmid) [Escherichia coli]